MSEKKPKSSNPHLSQTLPARSRDGLNQSMFNTGKTTADADKNPAKDSPAGGVDERESGKKAQGPEKTANASELKKPEPEQGQKSHIAAGVASSKKTHEPEKSANAPEQKKPEPVQGQKSHIAAGVASSKKTQEPEKTANASEQKKPEPEQGQKSHIAAGVSNPANTKSLLEKREEELIEREEECKNLYKRIKEKDETLQKLEGEVRMLNNDNKMMKSKLDEAIAEKKERQSVVNELEGKLEKSNSENTELISKRKELLKENAKLKEESAKTENTIMKLTLEKSALEESIEKYKKYMESVYRENKKKLEELFEDKEKEVRSLNNKLSEIIKERDDLKTRFSKLAGAKLTDQNADIADLSDPNRAMKVSERFGQLYDDEWTDAFEELKKKKMDGKDAIQLLLHILQECHAFCNNLKEAQIDSLNNVLLHPSQDITKFANEHRKNIGGLKERPRISSKDEKAVRNLRRQIGVTNTCIEEVKQVFVLETKSWVDRGFDKKQLEVCKPYLEKCAEVCWLMVLHDPPLYMKMDASEGDKMDPNLYTVYSTSGDKIKYLVWPPLYNEAGGGLISKGVAECVKVIKKK